MTEKELNKAIQTCQWRQMFGEIPICRGDCAPCHMLIEQGRCDTLRRIFAEEELNKEQTGEILKEE